MAGSPSLVDAAIRMDHHRFRLARVALGAAAVLLLAHGLHAALNVGGDRLDTVFDPWIYNALVLASALACVVRAVAIPGARAAWVFFALGATCWSAAEITWAALYGSLDEPPFPSLSDGLWLAFYPLCYVGVGLIIRERVRGLGASVSLDGLVAAGAAATIGAAVLFEPVLAATGGTTAEVATNLAYPLGDILMFALVVGAFAVTRWQPEWRLGLIGCSFLLSAVADGIYLFQAAGGTYIEGTILDTLWPAATLLLALGAWARAPRHRAVDAEGRGLLLVPVVCGLVAAGVLAWDHFHHLNTLAVAFALATLAGVIARTWLTFRENGRILARSREQAISDELTGLGNRRRLLLDLEAELDVACAERGALLLLFDLDGFKRYNDTYGHPAGDALLGRLGRALATAVEPWGVGYRLGGDEFCVLAAVPDGGAGRLVEACAAALTERSEGFEIGTSFGTAFLPEEAAVASDALRVADQRLYVHKQERRLALGRDDDVLLRALYEREPAQHARAQTVATLSVSLGRRLGLEGTELGELARAAELHDIGKLAVPDAILHKPGSLAGDELSFVRQHPAIGERILGASPVLSGLARVVRSTHERWDGAGYPDGLAGESIPLGARIIAVCDAYTAMTSERPHSRPWSVEGALEELRRSAGSQFDPRVVAEFLALVATGAVEPDAAQARPRS
jgi:diguanylate cyclase (GGDEF)-like protein